MSKYRAQDSQLNNQKNKTIGFNRDTFFQNSEITFDQFFKYNREYSKSYEAMKRNANTRGIREQNKSGIANNIKREMGKYMGVPLSNPTQILRMQLSQNLGINIPSHLKIPTNPAQLTLKVAKTVAKTIEKGYGM